MKRLSLQWRITLMTVLLIGVTCVSMKLLLCSSGMHYMDTIGDFVRSYGGPESSGGQLFVWVSPAQSRA